jgi:hypothetical protein
MNSIVEILQLRQREADLAAVDAQRVGVRIEAKVGPSASKIDEKLHAAAIEQEAEEARALAARRPVDLIERHVDAGSRSLVAAVEQLAAHRAELGQVAKDLVAVAQQALAVDRALVRIADERARAARDEFTCRSTP